MEIGPKDAKPKGIFPSFKALRFIISCSATLLYSLPRKKQWI